MLTGPAGGARIFVGLEPVDMLGSFGSMAGAARRLGLEPLDGHYYLFFNRRKQLSKMVWFDGSGWCLYSKRLVRGTFELPDVSPGTRQISVDPATLAALLEGIPIQAARRKWYRRKTA